MPHYDFLCHECKLEFSKLLTLAEYEDMECAKDPIRCPKCGSMDVEQAWSEAYVVTSRKS